MLAILLGGIAGLIIFNFLLYLTTWDKTFFLYTIYKSSFVLLILFISVVPSWYLYIIDTSLHRETISWGLGSIVNCLALIFSMKYLELQKWNKALNSLGGFLVVVTTSTVCLLTISILTGIYSLQTHLYPCC